jgi:hypothetical protein
MPQILVLTSPQDSADNGAVVYRERINTSDLSSEHFSDQLVERVGWAVSDADELEHQEKGARTAS